MLRKGFSLVVSLIVVISAISAAIAGQSDYRLVRIAHHPQIGKSLQVDGDVVYVGTPTGLHSYDVSNPSSPIPMDIFHTENDVMDVALKDGLLYAVDLRQRLYALDVSDPSSIALISNTSVWSLNRTEVYGVEVFDNYLCLGTEIDYQTGEIVLLNVSDPGNPTPVASLPFDGLVYDCHYRLGHLYVLATSSGLRILDISNVTSPQEVGHIDSEGAALDIAFNGEFAFLADQEGGLRILDISDPSNPVDTGQGYKDGKVYAVAVAPGYLYTGDENGVNVFDRNETAWIERIDDFETGWETWCIDVEDSLIYAINGGLSILKLGRPDSFGDFAWIGILALVASMVIIALLLRRYYRSREVRRK